MHGMLAIIVPWLDIGPHYSEFETRSFAFKVGAYSRAYAIAIVFVISGVGILLRKSWARKIGLVILAVDTIYSVPEMAWGFARGKPSLEIYALATVIFCGWNGLFFYLLWRQRGQGKIGYR